VLTIWPSQLYWDTIERFVEDTVQGITLFLDEGRGQEFSSKLVQLWTIDSGPFDSLGYRGRLNPVSSAICVEQ